MLGQARERPAVIGRDHGEQLTDWDRGAASLRFVDEPSREDSAGFLVVGVCVPCARIGFRLICFRGAPTPRVAPVADETQDGHDTGDRETRPPEDQLKRILVGRMANPRAGTQQVGHLEIGESLQNGGRVAVRKAPRSAQGATWPSPGVQPFVKLEQVTLGVSQTVSGLLDRAWTLPEDAVHQPLVSGGSGQFGTPALAEKHSRVEILQVLCELADACAWTDVGLPGDGDRFSTRWRPQPKRKFAT